MNSDYYETLDENFTQALNLYEHNYTHSELIDFLKTGNIVQRQICAIRLETLKSASDVDVVMSNLTGQDGKIREVISMKVNEFMNNPEYLKYFCAEKYVKIFLDAIIDINSNICRNIISAVTNLVEDKDFCKSFCFGLVTMTNNLLDVIEKFDFQEGKYKVNKEVFKLYWCLETIYEFYNQIEFTQLKNIILRSRNIQDYTIREKAAKILTRNFADEELKQIKNDLKHDRNYYVRRF